MGVKQDDMTKKSLDVITRFMHHFCKFEVVTHDDFLVLVASEGNVAYSIAWKSNEGAMQKLIDAMVSYKISAKDIASSTFLSSDPADAVAKFIANVNCPSIEEMTLKLAIAGE